MFVCHSVSYQKIFSKKKSILYCSITWLMALLSTVPNFFDHHENFFDRTKLACVMNKNISRIRFLILTILFVIVTGTILPLFYAVILRTTTKVIKNKIKEELENISAQARLLDNNQKKLILNNRLFKLKKSLKFSKGLFIITIIFLVSVFPIGIIEIIDEFYKLSSVFYSYSFLFSRICSILNPIFYGMYNSSFLYGYFNVIHVLRFRRRLSFKEYEENRKKN